MDFKSGGILNNDKRNFPLEKAHKLLGSATTRPATFQYPNIPQVYQKNYPACGAHAGVHFKEIQELEETGVARKLSPAFFWKKIKLIDSYKPEEGTDMQSIFKVMMKDGVCGYDLLPNRYTETLKEYTDASVVTKEMEEDAQPMIISSYAFATDLSFDNLKTQIWLNKEVLFLIQCDNGFFGRIKSIFTKRPYGHFVVACGYDEEGIWVIDSTEIEYPYKYFENKYAPFVIQAGTAIDLPNDVIKKLQLKISLLTKLLDLWKQLLGKK